MIPLVPTSDPAHTEISDSVIQTLDLQRSYKMGAREVKALRGVNMKIAPGRFVALKGRSGSGKTTLLNIIGGLDRPTAGTVQVFGRDLATLDENQLALWRRHELGFVFQSFGLLPTLTAYENVDLMLRLIGMPPKDRRQRVMESIDIVGLKKWIHHRPQEMSGGQQQRIGIARALAHHPKLILADEPTGELDSKTTTQIISIFREIVESEGITILMASHDPRVNEFVDEIKLLKDGQIFSVSS